MAIYFMFAILNFFLYGILRKIKHGKKMYLSIMILVLMFVASMRRWNIGADYPTYVNIFQNIQSIYKEYPMERGYLYANYLISFFTDNYVCFSFVVEIFVFFCIRKYILRYVSQEGYFWVMLVFVLNPYFYVQSCFNVIRQTVAIAIILLSIKYLFKEEWTYFIIFICVAGQIHKVAYIFALLIFFFKINWTRKKFLIILLITTFLNLFINNDHIFTRIARVFGYANYIGFGETEFNFGIFILFVVLVEVLFLLNYTYMYDDRYEKFFVDLYFLALSLLPLFVLNDIAYRVYVGMGILSLPAIPLVIRTYERKKQEKYLEYYIVKVGYVAYYFIFMLFFIYKLFLYKNSSYIPFLFFWQ